MDTDLAATLTAQLDDACLYEADLVDFCDHTVEGLIAIYGAEHAVVTVEACIAHHNAVDFAALKASLKAVA